MRRKKRYKRRYKAYQKRRRSRIRSTYRGRGNATEVKYLTLASTDQAVKLAITTTNSFDLFSIQNFVPNLLDNIQVGTSFSTRIGNKIYVMSINVKFLVYGCPSNTNYVVDSFLIRHIWHNQRTPTGSSIAGFFGSDSTVNFNSFVDRKSVTVHKDKTWAVRSNAYGTSSTGSTALSGGCREINYSIPINRYVTYTQSGPVKEDADVYSLAVLAATPGMNTANDTKQIACFQAKYRIYYKDA